MKTSKSRLSYLVAYTLLLLVFFLFTAWKAIDDHRHDLCPGSKDFEGRTTSGLKTLMPSCAELPLVSSFPADIDAGRMLVLKDGPARGSASLSLLYEPTITNATFPTAGDIFRTAIDASVSGIVSTPPGGGQNWDYTNLTRDIPKVVTYQPAANGAAFATFPTADLLTVENSSENYWDVTSTAVSLVGRSGYSLEGNLPINMNLRYTPPLTERKVPLNFFDINQTSSGILAPFGASQFPTAYLNLLPFTADSMRLRIAINRLDVVDAYGFLNIPGGTYEVLRQKSTRYQETRLDAKIPPQGWLDVTDVAIQYAGFAGGVDTLVSFYFYSNSAKEPVVVAYTDNTQLQVVQVEFKDLFSNCLNVTTILNSGPGSLREAFNCSTSGDTIRFDPAVFNQSISLDLPTILVDHPLILYGDPGNNITITNLNASNSGVLINIQDQLTISGLKITGQTSESMLFQLGSLGNLNLLNSDVNKFTLNKN